MGVQRLNSFKATRARTPSYILRPPLPGFYYNPFFDRVEYWSINDSNGECILSESVYVGEGGMFFDDQKIYNHFYRRMGITPWQMTEEEQ